MKFCKAHFYEVEPGTVFWKAGFCYRKLEDPYPIGPYRYSFCDICHERDVANAMDNRNGKWTHFCLYELVEISCYTD